MRSDTLSLEEIRLTGITLDNYPWLHERHRVFPQVFEDRCHKKIIELASGIGLVGERITRGYEFDKLVCSDIDPKCLSALRYLNLKAISFDLDNIESRYPFQDGSFDAAIALATLEHIIDIDHFMQEIYRILSPNGYLYLSVPNYAAPLYLIPLIVHGKTFHNPLGKDSKYEFYAHVRYFTYRTLIEFARKFGFSADTVYLALPKQSSRYRKLLSCSKSKAFLARSMARFLYTISPRFHSEPVICFAKKVRERIIRKVVL